MKQIKIVPNKTARTSTLEQYFSDIAHYPLLTEAEETELAHKIHKDKDKEALKKLINCNLRFVVSVAKTYQGQGMSLEDLIQEGNVGLQKAAERFDPTKGFKFISYAVWWINNTILKAISINTRAIRLPMNQVDNIVKLKRSENNLIHILERDPTEEELAEVCGNISTEKVIDLLSSNQYLSFDSPVSNDDTTTYEEILGYEETTICDLEDERHDLDQALSILTPREREVLTLSVGYKQPNEQPLSVENLAKRFNITKERIRQIRADAVRKLQKSPFINELRKYL